MSKQIDITHFDVEDLRMPPSCLGIYHICSDTFSVDRRKIRRYIRRARKRECSHPLRDWWRSKLNALERRL